MAKKIPLATRRPCIGQWDTEAFDVPPNAYLTARGMEVRRGYPFTEKARAAYTSAEIRASKRVRALRRWTRPDDNDYIYAAVDGGVWHVEDDSTFTLISLIGPSGIATRVGNTVTWASVPNGTLIGVVRAGDVFAFQTDGVDAGGIVGTVTATTLTLTSYAGSATSGTYYIWRKMNDGDTWIEPAGGRIFIADGTGPLHEYGPQSSGSSTYRFRQSGVPEPVQQPILALSSGGNLSAGDYKYYICFESLRGEIGNPVECRMVTATADQKTTMTVMCPAPEAPRAQNYRIYRSRAGSSAGYFHLTKDIWDKGTDITGQVLTIATGGLTVDAHIYRRVKFLFTGNSYEIADNDATTVTIIATENMAGESATDDVQIYGGYRISAIQTASATFVDYSSDDDLDTFNEAPTSNDVPPTGLKHLVSYEGGGRLGGVIGAKFYCSGRSPFDPSQGIRDNATFGKGEFAYWTDADIRAMEVGPEDGEDVNGIFLLGKTLFAVKKSSLWWLHNLSDDVIDHSFYPHVQDVGCLEGKTVFVMRDAAYWLGTVGQEVDLIRFDGQFATGRLRRRLRATLDDISSFSEAVGVGFKGRYYLSYDSDGGGTNDRTLRYDLAYGGVDEQAWGCGVFMNSFMDGTTPTLYCGAPTDVGHIYQVEGAAQDLGSDATRLLTSGDIHLPDGEHPMRPVNLQLVVIVE